MGGRAERGNGGETGCECCGWGADGGADGGADEVMRVVNCDVTRCHGAVSRCGTTVRERAGMIRTERTERSQGSRGCPSHIRKAAASHLSRVVRYDERDVCRLGGLNVRLEVRLRFGVGETLVERLQDARVGYGPYGTALVKQPTDAIRSLGDEIERVLIVFVVHKLPLDLWRGPLEKTWSAERDQRRGHVTRGGAT